MLTELKNSVASTLTDSDISIFSSLVGQNRYIEIFKELEGTKLDSIKIDLSNYDNVAPEYTNLVFEEQQENNNLGDKILDEYYLRTTDIIDRYILSFDYILYFYPILYHLYLHMIHV